MTKDARPQPMQEGSIIGGKYIIEKPVGIGGMGIVYRAQHSDIGRRVAIKILNLDLTANEELVTRFRREAKAAALIGHPGIVDVYDIGETEEGAPFIVMEYLEGETLSAMINARGRLPAKEAVLIIARVLEALSAAHKAGVIHRDLKPSNIFITTQKQTKVLDFGISKFQEHAEVDALTKTGISMGTPLYMSPEQMRDSRAAGPASDLYAVGANLYRAITGKPPFYSDVYTEILVKTLTETHKPLIQIVPDVPPELSNLVDKLLSKDPAARPQDAHQTKVFLLASVGIHDDTPTMIDVELANHPLVEMTVSDRPSRLRPPPPPDPKSHAGVWITAGVGAVVAIAAFVFLLPAKHHPTAESMPTPRSQPPRKPLKRAIQLHAEPQTARWTIDGATLDCNDCTIERELGTMHEAVARAEGYVEQRVSLKFDEAARPISITLAPVSVAPTGSSKHKDPRKDPHKKPPEFGIDPNNPFK